MRSIRIDSGSILADLEPTDELPHAAAIERVSALCLRGYTSNQLLRDIDAASMAHSLEVRVPFLDVPLLDVALSLPAPTKMGKIANVEAAYRGSYRATGGKRILIDAGKKARLLPHDIDLQPKRGFSMPFDRWLRGPLRDVVEDCLSNRALRMRGLIDPAAGSAVREEFYLGRRPWSQVWTLMQLELWCRAVVDRAATPLRLAS
jgi:asparagine synthase (glutamine-hydrolysing)